MGPTYEALRQIRRGTDGSPFDGVMMEYVNPVTNGPVMQTMGASMQMLRPGEAHEGAPPHRQLPLPRRQGAGHSIINGKRFDWAERDIFCVPSWAWHEHANARTARMPACSACRTCR
jgi:gentisate 1,2-dioxygenase